MEINQDPIRFDYTNCMADVVGAEHGITSEELAAYAGPSRAALAAVQARRTKDLRWMDLPYQAEVHAEIRAFAESVQGRFENVVVLGIGGSALGNIALQTALNGPFHDIAPPAGQPRLYVLDNVDPELIAPFLKACDPSKTIFNVISKSGGTAETMSQFLLFRDALIRAVGEDKHGEHLVITTDAKKGVLREIVNEQGYTSFIVPDGVGGRFSVLSPVGLVPAALMGMDTESLLAGAAAMDERCKGQTFEENPAQVHAAVQSLMQLKKHKPIAVTMSYSHRLKDFADWYAQLLAESIGKRKGTDGSDVFAGPTPVRAVGVTDQHSQVQLYVEGPFDKWFTLLSVEEPEHSVPIPHAFPDKPAVAYLGGRSLLELFRAERDGTRIALTEAGRPNATLSMKTVNAHTVGQFIQLLQVSVALMGEHYGVDAFNQPGVEAGKIAAYALMGRDGYEARAGEIAEATAKHTPRSV